MINQLANAMGLDPATGKPMPGSPAFSETNFLGPTCFSGKTCPQSGYWKILWSNGGGFYDLLENNAPRHFKLGEVMPTGLVGFYRPRFWPLSDKYTRLHKAVNWGLLG